MFISPLRIINDDQQSSYQDLISKCKECTIHQRTLETLIAEINKITNNIALPAVNSLSLCLLFFRENAHDIQKCYISIKLLIETSNGRLETVSHRSPISWTKLWKSCHKITSVKLLHIPLK